MTIQNNTNGTVSKAIPIGTGGGYSQVNTELEESLTGITPETAIPSTVGTPLVEVVAPATLPEGYTFDAEVGGRSFIVTVPPGGVEEGQKFSVPFPSGPTASGLVDSRASVPVGNWKDGMCDFCRYGCCHPILWNSWCCPLVALGQVMMRMKLTWRGEPGNVAQTASTFRTCLFITIGFYVIDRILNSVMSSAVSSSVGYSQPRDYEDNYPYGEEVSVNVPLVVAITVMRSILFIAYAIYLLVTMMKTRAYIRNKYAIPERNCHGCEDCCCSFWCYCCTVSQMARHTADYDTYRGICCSETGLPPHVPLIV